MISPSNERVGPRDDVIGEIDTAAMSNTIAAYSEDFVLDNVQDASESHISILNDDIIDDKRDDIVVKEDVSESGDFLNNVNDSVRAQRDHPEERKAREARQQAKFKDQYNQRLRRFRGIEGSSTIRISFADDEQNRHVKGIYADGRAPFQELEVSALDNAERPRARRIDSRTRFPAPPGPHITPTIPRMTDF